MKSSKELKSSKVSEISLDSFSLPSFRRRVASYGLFSRLPIEESHGGKWEEMEKDVKLYRWVIDRAFLDMLGGGTEEQKQESTEWLFKDSSGNFSLICQLAYIEETVVQKFAKKVRDHYAVV